MSSYTRQQLEEWIKTIEVKGRLLDIGGSQKPAIGRVKVVGDVVSEILDLPEPHENSPKPSIVHDINERFNFPVGFEKYDIITCFEVMEYVWNPLEALRNMHRMLNDGGKAYISTAFIYPVHNPVGQDYLRYTEAGMVKLLDKVGFGINSVTSRVAMEPHMLMSWYANEGMRPARDWNEHNVIGHLWEVTKL